MYTKHEDILEIKKAAQIILDMINNGADGQTCVRVNDVILSGDIGYVEEFLEDILESL